MFNIEEIFHTKFPRLIEKLPSSVTRTIISVTQSVLNEKEFHELNKKTEHLRGSAFADGALEHLNISYTLNQKEIANIPATGRLMIIANHITGGSDAFSLVQLIANSRENKKVRMVVNGMLMGMKQASDIMIPVDNISGKITKKSLEAIQQSLEDEEAIIIFPAGIVSRLSYRGLLDTPWKASFLKMAKRSSCPILPIRIKSRNSFLFYFTSLILPKKISGLLLPREFIRASRQIPLHFHIGKVIPCSSYADNTISIHQYIDLFYKHLYTLGTKKDEILKTEITIGRPNNKRILKAEVKKSEFLGNTIDGKKIILTDAVNSPFLVRELGRVREVSFRAIGGGTGKAQDNDFYDNYYRHLILWDEEELEIVGAYRIGECKNIIKDKGKKGLYTYNLCNFNEQFEDYCNVSVELGRSFVQPKYWGSRALDNLWQGIGAYLAHNPNIQYSYGTVTINADTPKKAVAALVYFYSSYFACTSNMMKAKTPYIISDEDKSELDLMFKDLSYKDGFFVLKKHLKDLGTTIPTLFKQYAELYDEGAVRFFDFSVNDDLLGVVEGFIIADNSRMKESKRKRYIENFEKLNILDPVTNLYNKAHFNEIIDSITKYQRKSDISFSLVMIDVTHIKSIDENENIPVSDDTLKKLALTLEKSLRDNDIIARYNAKEFIVMLKNVTDTEIKMILDKLRYSIERVKLNDIPHITCSIGATLYQAPENINDTCTRTKYALNEAKNSTSAKVVINQSKDLFVSKEYAC